MRGRKEVGVHASREIYSNAKDSKTYDSKLRALRPLRGEILLSRLLALCAMTKIARHSHPISRSTANHGHQDRAPESLC
jgi:hypothetical protein